MTDVDQLAREIFIAACADASLGQQLPEPAWAYAAAEAFLAEQATRHGLDLIASRLAVATPPVVEEVDPMETAAPAAAPASALTAAQRQLLLELATGRAKSVKLNVARGLMNAGMVEDSTNVRTALREGNRLPDAYPLTAAGLEAAIALEAAA